VNNVDGLLYNWSDLDNNDFNWDSILIGNGASINVWDKFRYSSIFAHATSSPSSSPLNRLDRQLFTSLVTQNFEQVLSSLKTAGIINRALGLPDSLITQRYDSIKQSLVGTINELHVPWRLVPDYVIAAIRAEILNYRYIFTTNYDLLIYWSMMFQNNPAPFIDYFFNEAFDSTDTEIFDSERSEVFYLHGALHLYKDPSGKTLKRRAGDSNLLDLFGQPYPGHPNAIPLIVSEGTSEDTLSSINQSDYLMFAFNQFMNNQNEMVIFGHSLSDSDMHIVEAMRTWEGQRIAISLLPDTATNILTKQASLVAKLPRARLYFFDATTHPLGSSILKIIQQGTPDAIPS